jgi:cyclase
VGDAVRVPVVASGGAGTLEHFADALIDGRADAVLAASRFHFEELTIRQVKEYLAALGLQVRI